jgi:hypothetical protein
MSESSFPFQGTSVADGPADFEEASGNRRTVLILAVVGVLVLGALAYFFVFAGGDEPTDTSLPTRRSNGTQSTPTPTPSVPPVVKAPKLSNKAIGKDPFKPLVVPPAAGSGVVAGGGAVAGGGLVVTPIAGGGGAVVTTQPGTSGGTTGGTSTGGSAVSSKPLTVKVISVTADNSSGRVTVGAKTYSVAVGDVFGTYFKALRLKNGECGSFQYGDERFELCEGETAKMQ